MAPLPANRADVLHGFEAGMSLVRTLLLAGRHVGIQASAAAAEEFFPGLLQEARGFLGRGGQLRLLAVGAVGPDFTALLADAGVAGRTLDEGRDFGYFVTDREAAFWPLEQPRDSPLQEVTVHVRDPAFLAHLWLAFERAWERGRPLA